jgi:hypothetical protein
MNGTLKPHAMNDPHEMNERWRFERVGVSKVWSLKGG